MITTTKAIITPGMIRIVFFNRDMETLIAF
jgi:hypothetical protein